MESLLWNAGKPFNLDLAYILWRIFLKPFHGLLDFAKATAYGGYGGYGNFGQQQAATPTSQSSAAAYGAYPPSYAAAVCLGSSFFPVLFII